MSDIYEASVSALRSDLLERKNRVERSLTALKSQEIYYADEHRKLIRLLDALLTCLRIEIQLDP